MTKAAALDAFFNSFGLPAYPTTSVPDDAVFPFLTYEATFGGIGDVLSTTVELWYYTDGEAIPNKKAQEISEECGNGKVIPCDGGAFIVYAGSWQSLKDDVDDTIKRRRSVFSIEYITRY